MFSEYEKLSLIEYCDKSNDRLIFLNPQNQNISMKMLNLVKKILFRKKN